jgi:thioredoxin reductase (NADPH)
MNKPVIFAVDDESAVLSAIARDLRKEYGGDYRILRATSGPAALEMVRQLKLEEDPLALFVVDQRMPGMSGVEFLREALVLYPDAQRVLLTAYADTDAAIRAINEIRLDHYLMKPWDPPEERLYPVLTDLLDTWWARFRPPFEGVRVVGHRWSADAHRIKDFLARNLTPYQWLDVEDDADAQQLRELVGETDVAALPLVVFPDGSHLSRPDNAMVAERNGLRTQAEADSYDLIVVGAGPAGLAAGVYGASEGLRTLLIEREAPGGQAGQSSRIENYLGFPVGLSGGDLTRRAVAQATRFGAEILTPAEAVALRMQDGYPVITLADGGEVASQALLIATGVSYRMLDVPGAARLAGAGVYYGAAITEAMAADGEDVFVVGGGNSAGQGAMYLSRFARSVTILVRGESLAKSMSHYLVAQIDETPNISVRTGSQIAEVQGDDHLERIVVEERVSGQRETSPAHAIFVFIGAAPRTEWLGDIVQRDGRGFILSGTDLTREGRRPHGWSAARDPLWLETSVPGVFVAGDVRHRSVKRVASAVGEGAMAVQFVHQHLTGPVLAPRTAVGAAR